MRIGVFALLLGLVACDGGGRPPSRPPDAGVRVSGCDDPAVWTASGLEEAGLSYYVGGEPGPCSAQLPLYRAGLAWRPHRVVEDDEREHLNRVCWRMTDASTGSGWMVGQTFMTVFSSAYFDASVNLMGFARPVTVEGRVLRDDGTLAFSIPPTELALEPAQVYLPDASNVIAVMSADAWAERDVVQLWGERITTDEVLGAGSLDLYTTSPITLHRVGADIVLRTWSHPAGKVAYSDLVIGSGARARMSKRGNAVVVDKELVIVEQDGDDESFVRRRVSLAAEPLEIVQNLGGITLHMPGRLVNFNRSTDESVSRPVGDGALLQNITGWPSYFFDGITFHPLVSSSTALDFDEHEAFTPRAADLAAIGKPVEMADNVVFGERGVLAMPHDGDLAPGPSSASYAELFGDGTLGPLSTDSAAYVIEHDDGRSELYVAPGGGLCSSPL